MNDTQKPFACARKGCKMAFTNEDHLTVHHKKHDVALHLGIEAQNNTADQTPTPTRFIRNCEEVGLFQDLQNVNPFDETFRKAAELATAGTLHVPQPRDDDTLHTPHVFPPVEEEVKYTRSHSNELEFTITPIDGSFFGSDKDDSDSDELHIEISSSAESDCAITDSDPVISGVGREKEPRVSESSLDEIVRDKIDGQSFNARLKLRLMETLKDRLNNRKTGGKNSKSDAKRERNCVRKDEFSTKANDVLLSSGSEGDVMTHPKEGVSAGKSNALDTSNGAKINLKTKNSIAAKDAAHSKVENNFLNSKSVNDILKTKNYFLHSDLSSQRSCDIISITEKTQPSIKTENSLLNTQSTSLCNNTTKRTKTNVETEHSLLNTKNPATAAILKVTCNPTVIIIPSNFINNVSPTVTNFNSNALISPPSVNNLKVIAPNIPAVQAPSSGPTDTTVTQVPNSNYYSSKLHTTLPLPKKASSMVNGIPYSSKLNLSQGEEVRPKAPSKSDNPAQLHHLSKKKNVVRLRELNRIAQSRSRERQKVRYQQMLNEMELLRKEKKEIWLHNQHMQKEIALLKAVLLHHEDCSAAKDPDIQEKIAAVHATMDEKERKETPSPTGAYKKTPPAKSKVQISKKLRQIKPKNVAAIPRPRPSTSVVIFPSQSKQIPATKDSRTEFDSIGDAAIQKELSPAAVVEVTSFRAEKECNGTNIKVHLKNATKPVKEKCFKNNIEEYVEFCKSSAGNDNVHKGNIKHVNNIGIKRTNPNTLKLHMKNGKVKRLRLDTTSF